FLVVKPHDLAAGVDPRHSTVVGVGKGEIDGGEHSLIVEKEKVARPSLFPPFAIAIGPHDLAVIVDPYGLSDRSAGDVDWGERPLVIEKALEPGCTTPVEVGPHDLAVSVDPIGCGGESAREGDINAGEYPLIVEKATRLSAVGPHDLAASVD